MSHSSHPQLAKRKTCCSPPSPVVLIPYPFLKFRLILISLPAPTNFALWRLLVDKAANTKIDKRSTFHFLSTLIFVFHLIRPPNNTPFLLAQWHNVVCAQCDPQGFWLTRTNNERKNTDNYTERKICLVFDVMKNRIWYINWEFVPSDAPF